MTKAPQMGLLEWGLLLFLSVLWGGSFFFSKVALAELPPFTVVLGRVAIAALALYAYLRATGRTIPASGEAWLAFLGMGFLNNLIPFSLIFWGQTALASGLASILNATTPIFSILVAHWLTADEKMSPQKIVGVLLGVLGVVVLMSGSAFAGNGPPLWALLACLGAALSYGFAGTFGRRFRRLGIAPAVVAFGQTTVSTMVMLPIVALVDAPWHLPAPHLVTIGALLALALISTAFAYIIYFHLLSVGGATNSSLVTLLIPVSAILLGSVVLGERLSPSHFLGMALITLGLLSIDGRIFAMLRRAPAM
jgi:drug/metabolite transporter (DMT)-like permease